METEFKNLKKDYKEACEDVRYYIKHIENLQQKEKQFKFLTAVGYSIVAVLCVGVGILIGFFIKYNKILCE